jgi:hypothetical protein
MNGDAAVHDDDFKMSVFCAGIESIASLMIEP